MGEAAVTALHTEAYRRFAAALAKARVDAGLSQYQLADRLGVDQSFVSKYESARRRLDVVEFLRIVQAIGVDAQAVLAAVPPLEGTGGKVVSIPAAASE